MKLLHITATHLNPTGGIPVVLKNLVEEQNNINGVESRVLSLSETTNNINSAYFDILNKMTFKNYVANFNPSVVILHSFFYIAYNNVVNVLTKMNIPYFIEPHGSFGTEAMNKSYLKKRIANNIIFRKQIKCAKGFIFLNESEKAASVYKTQNDIVIPNGIIVRNFKKNIVEYKNPIIYFIGRYDIHHKGLDYLISALEILEAKKKTYKIFFWGSGDEKSINFLKGKICNFKNISVDISGPLFGIEKDEVLENRGLMVLTSRYEGFPMTVLEAWNYGNPCLVTPGTNVSNEVRDNGLGWCVKLDAQSIADGIEMAVNDYTNNRVTYIKRCKTYVYNKYKWKEIAKLSYQKISDIIN